MLDVGVLSLFIQDGAIAKDETDAILVAAAVINMIYPSLFISLPLQLFPNISVFLENKVLCISTDL